MTIEIAAIVFDKEQNCITICECESIDMLIADAKECEYKFSQVQLFVNPTDKQMKEIESVTDIIKYEWGGTNISLPINSEEIKGPLLYRQSIVMEK